MCRHRASTAQACKAACRDGVRTPCYVSLQALDFAVRRNRSGIANNLLLHGITVRRLCSCSGVAARVFSTV